VYERKSYDGRGGRTHAGAIGKEFLRRVVGVQEQLARLGQGEDGGADETGVAAGVLARQAEEDAVLGRLEALEVDRGAGAEGHEAERCTGGDGGASATGRVWGCRDGSHEEGGDGEELGGHYDLFVWVGELVR